MSLSWEDEVDGAIGPVSHDIEDGFYREELSFNLSDNGLVEVTSICPFGPETSDAAVDDVMGSVPNDVEDRAVEEELLPGLLTNFHISEIWLLLLDLLMTSESPDDIMGSVLCHDISDGTVSKAMIADGDTNDLGWSMLE